MARSFASGQSISLPANAVPIAASFTFSVWGFPTGTGIRTFVSGYALGAVQVRVNADNTIYLVKQGVAGILLSTATVTNSAWNHVAVTDTGSAQSITVNSGTPKTGSTAVSYTAYTNETYRVSYPGTEQYLGSMADWAFWNVILTQEEIKALAAGIRPYRIRPKSLICYLPLGGLSSPEPDLSGNAFNGVVTGATYANDPPFTMFTPRWPRNYDAVGNYWKLYFSKNSGAYTPVTTTSVGVKSADASSDADETKILIPRLS